MALILTWTETRNIISPKNQISFIQKENKVNLLAKKSSITPPPPPPEGTMKSHPLMDSFGADDLGKLQKV